MKVKRSPKVGINQLSSMEFRGLASDCVCNHRTPPSSSYASSVSYHRLSSVSLFALPSSCSTHLKGSLSCTLSSSRISNISPPRTYFTPVHTEKREGAALLYDILSQK